MASLFVIQGADQGKRFEFMSSPVALGRDSSNAVGSTTPRFPGAMPSSGSNATATGSSIWRRQTGLSSTARPVDQSLLHSGDRVQLGQTVMLFHEGNGGGRRDLTARVDLLAKSSPDDRSAILEEHSVGRRLARPQGSGRRGRLAARTAAEPVGHVPRDPGHQRYPRYRRTHAPDPRSGLRIDRRRPRRDSPERRVGSARPQGRALARRSRARRADVDLANDRRLCAREGRRRHHQRRPHRQAIQHRAVDRRLADPRGHLRADPGAAHHPGRHLRRHPGRRQSGISPAGKSGRAAGSARTSSC